MAFPYGSAKASLSRDAERVVPSRSARLGPTVISLIIRWFTPPGYTVWARGYRSEVS